MQEDSIEKFITGLSKQNYEHTRSKQQQILVHNTTYTVDENDNIKKIGETTYELIRTNRNN